MTENLHIHRLDSSKPDFDVALAALVQRDTERDPQLERTVRDIIAAVRRDGDQALLDYSRRFDRRTLDNAEELQIPRSRIDAALNAIPTALRDALETCRERVDAYHRHQLPGDWRIKATDGTVLGQQVRPLERVGVYVPGGRASYPSSVLMNVIPARVAGVDEIVMMVPAPDDELNDAVLAAAAIAGIDRLYTVGGAQAIAALAYGTRLVPRVDKIVGPGNRFVAEAKRQVFGQVGIDMIAGPSEVLVIADDSVAPEWLAYDLFAQAEHDEYAQSILISADAGVLDRVHRRMSELLETMPRAAIIRGSLQARGALIKVGNIDEALRLSNRIAPEHLELAVYNPERLLAGIRHAGAIFVGAHSAEVLGDYCAGPSHVLPTAGSARYSSPLDVHDFLKRSSIIHCSPRGAHQLAGVAAILADREGLTAHAGSARCRLVAGDDTI